jgi:small subunit ribosomal protein S4
MKGVTGDNMLGILESRLDNVVLRAGFATSRAQARQLVRHGHIGVNGRRTTIPSFGTRPGDVVEVVEKSRKLSSIIASRDATAHYPSPNWLDVDRENFKARVTQSPKREDLVQIQLNEQLIVELYSK